MVVTALTTLADFLPTLARARAEGLSASSRGLFGGPNLLASDPDEEVALAVVVVEARVLARGAEERQLQLPPRVVDALPTAPPPLPERWDTRARHCHLVERHHVLTDCAVCELNRGMVSCVPCGGSGWITQRSGDNQVRVRCPSCGGSRMVTCATCGGAGDALWVRVMDLTDETSALRYAYVPSMVDALDLAVGERFETVPPELPEVLRFDLTPPTHGSAYRGERIQGEQGFHGFGFGDALGRARAAVEGLAGGARAVIREETITHAWPLLWLRYRRVLQRTDVALVVSPLTHRLEAITV